MGRGSCHPVLLSVLTAFFLLSGLDYHNGNLLQRYPRRHTSTGCDFKHFEWFFTANNCCFATGPSESWSEHRSGNYLVIVPYLLFLQPWCHTSILTVVLRYAFHANARHCGLWSVGKVKRQKCPCSYYANSVATFHCVLDVGDLVFKLNPGPDNGKIPSIVSVSHECQSRPYRAPVRGCVTAVQCSNRLVTNWRNQHTVEKQGKLGIPVV